MLQEYFFPIITQFKIRANFASFKVLDIFGRKNFGPVSNTRQAIDQTESVKQCCEKFIFATITFDNFTSDSRCLKSNLEHPSTERKIQRFIQAGVIWYQAPYHNHTPSVSPLSVVQLPSNLA